MKKLLFLLLTSIFLLASCGGTETVKAPTDIINPEAEYLYFYSSTCMHCQELNRIAESRDLYSKISIEKREITYNDENRKIFLDLLEEIDTEESGVPFVYDRLTGKVAVGVKPALILMTSRLGSKSTDTPEPTTGTGEIENISTETTSSGSQQ